MRQVSKKQPQGGEGFVESIMEQARLDPHPKKAISNWTRRPRGEGGASGGTRRETAFLTRRSGGISHKDKIAAGGQCGMENIRRVKGVRIFRRCMSGLEGEGTRNSRVLHADHKMRSLIPARKRRPGPRPLCEVGKIGSRKQDATTGSSSGKKKE